LACGQQQELATPVEVGQSVRPVNGDYSICLACGNLAIFDDLSPIGLRPLVDLERLEAIQDPDIQHALRAWRETRR
jgi:hypothetical protein